MKYSFKYYQNYNKTLKKVQKRLKCHKNSTKDQNVPCFCICAFFGMNFEIENSKKGVFGVYTNEIQGLWNFQIKVKKGEGVKSGKTFFKKGFFLQ